MRQNKFLKTEDSFTLVELLVVIGILAILTAAVVIVLNPAELLKQSRDSKRTTDLASLNNAIKLLLTQNPDVNLGSASTVYISLGDSSSTCGSYSLPVLPSGWKYNCVAASNLTKADSGGWIPVSFASAGGVASLSALPVDPQNTVQNYYSYVAGGSWQFAIVFESGKYAAKEAADGGLNPASYEVGSNLSLAPFLGGLAGYWNFDGGSGATVQDASGNGNTGTSYSSTGTASFFASSSCKSGSCIRVDGVDDVVRIPSAASDELNSSSTVTAMAWISQNSSKPEAHVIGKGWGDGYELTINNGQAVFTIITPSSSEEYAASGSSITNQQWTFVAGTYDGSSIKVYINGELKGSKSFSAPIKATSHYVAIGNIPHVADGAYFNYGIDGWVDDVRVYNRALSAGEIQAIYNATK